MLPQACEGKQAVVVKADVIRLLRFRAGLLPFVSRENERSLARSLTSSRTSCWRRGCRAAPASANEGIASLLDDEKRTRTREQILARIVRTKQWPSVGVMLNIRTIPPHVEATLGEISAT